METMKNNNKRRKKIRKRKEGITLIKKEDGKRKLDKIKGKQNKSENGKKEELRMKRQEHKERNM